MLHWYWLIAMCVLGLVAFLAYGFDKRKAKKHHFRTKEALLLGLGFFGGSVGALLGMNVFRHKTRHWYFWMVNVAGLVWQVALLLFLWK